MILEEISCAILNNVYDHNYAVTSTRKWGNIAFEGSFNSEISRVRCNQMLVNHNSE